MAKPYSDLVAKLFKEEADRRLAQSFADHISAIPGMADRVESLLREGARTAEIAGLGQMTPDQSWEYLKDFAANIGAPPHAVAAFDNWLSMTSAEMAAEAPPAQSDTEQPAASAQAQPPASATPLPVAVPARPVGPSREQLLEQNTQHLKNMRADVGSPDWRAYHKEGGSARYLANLQALEALDAAPSPTPAIGEAAPPPAETTQATSPQ